MVIFFILKRPHKAWKTRHVIIIISTNCVIWLRLFRLWGTSCITATWTRPLWHPMPLTSLRCRRAASWPPSSDETWVLSPRCCSTPPPIRCFWETTPISIPSTNISVPPIRSSGPILIVIKNMKLHLQLFEEGVSNSPQFLSFFLSGCLCCLRLFFLARLTLSFHLPSQALLPGSVWRSLTWG